MIALHHGDCREIVPALGVTVDAVVTDPPYHLLPTVQRFSKPGSAPPVSEFFTKDGKSKGASPYLRTATGFMNQQWDGGDIARDPATWAAIGSVLRPGGFLVAFGGTRTYHRLASAIEDAGFVVQDCLMWLFATGFPKRRDMLKPAYEPIVLAYKPGGKRTLQVDECRIGTESTQRRNYADIGYGGGLLAAEYETGGIGRWPANICHDGSDEVVALFPESASGPPNDMSGFRERQSGFRLTGGNGGYSDNGSAARFFFSAKAGTQDRWGSRHPTVKPVELMKWLVALVTPPGGTVLDPFAGSGTTAVAALATGRNAILIEREAAYVADIRERLAFYEGSGTHSVQAKHRHRVVDHGPLFAPQPLTAAEDAADSLASYNAAITAIGERVKAGGEIPEFMLPRKAPP